ncbi:MAG TPA: hypothetical protein VJZ75_05150 [Candidatus Bathyarchaeia archaeon]|nr:hypothetical protein [Candidatus Bathyarchaeia archaeon]
MAQAYTPGLKVKKFTIVSKTRRLPLPGEVLVREGESVAHDQIVARTQIPGGIHMMNVANILGVEPEDTNAYMQKKVNESVQIGEVIANRTSFFGLLKSIVRAPITGTVEMVSTVTGQVALREQNVPVELNAYIPGKIVQVIPREGVTISTPAALVQGIFGIGGETHGELKIVTDSRDETLTSEKIETSCKDKILVGGALVTIDALTKAIQMGVRGIVVGGIEHEDVIKFLGGEIGVAITGQEDIGTTLIITEGFGKMSMSIGTFNLLKSFNGRRASINGATQIRAGVMRPEVIIALEDDESRELNEKADEISGGMAPGTQVRIIRDPYFGIIGHVSNLPVELQTVESESKVRVVEVELEDKQRVIVPRANVEIIED